LVQDANQYYENLHRNLKGLSTKTGYTKYFESWNPAEITEQEVVIEGLKHLFVTQSIDNRIESALPLLARIQQQGTAMKEANIFEAWAQRLTEGTWQLPDTPEKQNKLIELMQQDLPVGADATNVTEQLYDLLGDDHLFDQLEALAERDANTDARQVIYDRMSELSDHPEVRSVIEKLQIDPESEMNPAEATPADLSATTPEQSDSVPSGQGNITKLAEDSLASIRRAAGLIKENITLDETGSTIEHIKNTFKPEIEKFERTGNLDKHLFKALFDYYEDVMPYGAKTAEDLDPYEWVGDRLTHELGLTKSNLSPWEKFKLRNDDARREAGLEPNDWSKHPDFDESVMHGDYAEEAKDPMTQTEDSAGTLQPAYPEYADPLTDILKTAGVAPQNTPAPDYETGELDEGPIGAVAGEILAPELGPLAPIIGSAVGDALSPDDKEETNEEGWGLNPTPATMEETSSLAGQYGHSGKMKEVGKETSFLDRLKELAGMVRN